MYVRLVQLSHYGNSLHVPQRTLKKLPLATVTFPNHDQIYEFASAMALRYPSMFGMFAFLDGMKIRVEQSSDDDIQNAYYNGWTCSHYISNIFMFSPDGCIIYSIVNCPGSWHDSVVTQLGGLYNVLHEKVPPGYFAVADSAFPVYGNDGMHIKRPPKANETSTMSQLNLTNQQMHDLVSMRQSAEWGIKSLEGTFTRLKRQFPWKDQGNRGNILENCVMLVNLRARLVGLNQIRIVWMPWLEREWGV